MNYVETLAKVLCFYILIDYVYAAYLDQASQEHSHCYAPVPAED